MKQRSRGRVLLLILTLLGFVIPTEAQTYYEVSYRNPKGQLYYGLMTYEDDDNCTMRIIRVNKKKEITDAQDITYVGVQDEEDGEFTALCPADDDTGAPNMVFMWKEFDKDEEVVPLICFDLDKLDLKAPESFGELSLGEIDDEYLEQFYDKDDEMYQSIVKARGEINTQNTTIAENLGDGTEIYRTIMTMLAEAGNEEASEKVEEINKQDAGGSGSAGSSGSGSSGSAAAQGTTLHLVEVVNTKVSDIGEACERDYLNILNEMKGISKALGIQLKVYPVTGDKYSQKSVVNALKSLKPGKDDIVFFLYSGHGFRFDNQKSKFPCFDLSTSEYEEVGRNNYLEMKDINDAICQKGARLNIVLSDCCNTKIGANAPYSNRGTLFSRSSNNFSVKRLGELFLQARGSIISTAASPGQSSICDMTGGYFTLSFIRSLRKEISAMNEETASWDRLIDNTISAARKRGEEAGNRQQGVKQLTVN